MRFSWPWPSASGRSPKAAAQEPKCLFYKVGEKILNVTKEPGEQTFVDVLEQDEIVCVTQARAFGPRDFAFVAHKIVSPNKRQPVEGWTDFHALRQLSAAEVAAMQSGGPAAVAAAPATAPASEEEILRFSEPIPFGPYPVNGRSIEQLITGVPLFPPIEGLDESIWKKNCGTCHKWDRKSLCDQGITYLKNPRYALRQPHPYGGPDKVALMRWAKTGCQ